MDFEAIARHVAQTIEHSGSAKAVFGEPLKLQTQIVIPVAAVGASLGGGGGHAPIGGGGGGGLNIQALPVGYLHEKDGAVVFSPIELPVEVLKHTARPETHAAQSPPSSLLGRLRRQRA